MIQIKKIVCPLCKGTGYVVDCHIEGAVATHKEFKGARECQICNAMGFLDEITPISLNPLYNYPLISPILPTIYKEELPYTISLYSLKRD